jgi:hypothetical protein
MPRLVLSRVVVCMYVDAAEYEVGFRNKSKVRLLAFLLIRCLLVSLLTSLHPAVEKAPSISRNPKRRSSTRAPSFQSVPEDLLSSRRISC